MNTFVDTAARMQPELNSAKLSLQSERAKTQQYAADLAEANKKCNGFVTAIAALKQRSAELDRNYEAAAAAVRRLTAERDEVIEAEIAREAANAVSASTRDVVGTCLLSIIARFITISRQDVQAVSACVYTPVLAPVSCEPMHSALLQ
jgi:Ribonuclease G/E